MKRVIILYVLFLLSPYIFAQNYKETIQTEIDAINKMPLRIAYLVPLDSLGKVIEDEYMEFDQIHSYKILDDGQIKNANILFTMYFDSDNNIRKVFILAVGRAYCKALAFSCLGSRVPKSIIFATKK